MKYEFLQPKFTEGVLAKSLQGRSVEEFYNYGYKSSKNMIPVLSGPVVKRPGTNYIGEAKDPSAVFIPFFKDKDNTYILELGVFDTTNVAEDVGYLRVWSQNRLLNNKLDSPTPYEITTGFPWSAAELPTLKSTQSGDIIFVCCPTKPPQKISRTLDIVTEVKSSYFDAHSGTPYVITVTESVMPFTDTLAVGMTVTGPGIPSGTTITSIASATTIWISNAATVAYPNGSNVDLTFVGSPSTNTADVAEDSSVWTITEFITEDGPYDAINVWHDNDHTKRYTLKLTTEPSTPVSIGDIQFNTIANTCVLANHGLQVGQKIRLNGSTTPGWGNLRKNTSGKTNSDGKAQSKMDSGVSVAIASVEFTVTIASPAVFTKSAHGLFPNNRIQLTTTGTLPTGLATSTNYYVSATDLETNTFKVSATPGGDVINTTGSQSGTHSYEGTIGSDLFNIDVYIVAVTSTSFQFSETDGGTAVEFELVLADPETTASNTKVTLEKFVYTASSTPISLTLYNNNNTDVGGFDASADSLTYFTPKDIGRLIRINPLLIGGKYIGGIKWAWGIIKSVVNTGANGVITVEFKTEMANTRGTYGTSEFRLGAFSLGVGYPQVAQIYQQRMVFAANTVQPSTIWLSETANFYSFSPTVIAEQGSPESVTDGVSVEIIVDTNGLTFTLDSDTLDEIKWLGESKKLTIGTSAGVYMLYGAETNLTVTPFRFTINKESTFSATNTPPVIVSHALIYTQIGGKDVQILELEGGTLAQWVNSKISLKGYDIIKTSEIKKMVWQERPNNIIWIMMLDGRLLSLSYDRESKFQAWSEHVIAGKIYRKITATIQATTDRVFTTSNSSGLLLTDTLGTHGLLNTNIIQVTTTGTLPTGLSLSTNYYVVNKTTNNFKLALTSGGSAIAYTDDGAGTHSWHKPTIYTVAGDQTSMFVVDKYATVSNYADSNWNVSQEIMNVFVNASTNTEITTRLDSSDFANTTSTNAIIEADGSSHAQIKDIDMIPTVSHDQIWFKIKRTINGTDVYYVETLGRFPTEGALERNEYVFSDSAVTGSVTSTKIVSGLKHLRNEEVQIYYEGMQHPNLTVTNTGGGDETITLSHTQGNQHVTGLPYDAELETLEPSAPQNQFSYTKRLIKAAVLIEESLGIQLEYNDLSEELLFRTTLDAMGRQISLFSGLRKLSLSGIGWDTHNIKIVSNGPFPMQLNAIIIEAETGGS